MSPSLSSPAHQAYTSYPSASTSSSTPPPPPPPTAYHHPTATATASLASIYASYVVRVHTRHGIKTLSFDMLAAYFTFTAKKAAEDLGISSRTLIRVCRSLGIRRWPYLGFRSEKNVERIRHEAIENLRRKLEKEGAAASPTAVHHPNASSLRGASAKRLLQVKLPHGGSGVGHMSPLPNSHQRLLLSPAGSQGWSVQSIDDTESEDDTDVEMMEARPSSSSSSFSDIAPTSSATASLLTPQSAPSGFQLELRSISPKKQFPVARGAASSHTSQQQQHATGPWTPKPMAPLVNQQLPRRRVTHPFHPSAASALGMPSLNLLVDASLLTAFKHDTAREFAVAPPQASLHAQQQPPPQCPRMSMRDILSHTAMAA